MGRREVLVAGVDFGTQSVRAAIFSSERGRLGAGESVCPVRRDPRDPDLATQAPGDQLRALTEAVAAALVAAGVDGRQVAAIAADTTGSTVVPVDSRLTPLGGFYLWCDHRAWREAAEITRAARRVKLPALDWCGGAYSSEWGFAKVLHWLRGASGQDRAAFHTALENCDWIAAVLCGITDPAAAPRSVCAMGHKWMWNPSLGGFPPEEFWCGEVDPLLKGVRARLDGRFLKSDQAAGLLSDEWAKRLGLPAGIPVAAGALDAHWDAVGAGIRLGDVVNVAGTSSCIMAMAPAASAIEGVSGVAAGSIHPGLAGIEAGLAACGDLFDAIARRAGVTVAGLFDAAAEHRAGQTGLLRIAWDNGDRTVLANPGLAGVTMGWTLTSTAPDELFAAIEGTAMQTRIILERIAAGSGAPIERLINAGGIPRRGEVFNRVYANVLGRPVLVPEADATSVGAAVFAFLAAGAFPSVEAAQEKLSPRCRVVVPDDGSARFYEAELFPLFRDLYFSLGESETLPRLRRRA